MLFFLLLTVCLFFMSCFTLLVSRFQFHWSVRAAHGGHRWWPSQFFTGESFHLRDVRFSGSAFHGISWAFNRSFAVCL